jgi:hypothetical protein
LLFGMIRLLSVKRLNSTETQRKDPLAPSQSYDWQLRGAVGGEGDREGALRLLRALRGC